MVAAMSLLDSSQGSLNGNNVIGRLTYGLIGLDLKSKNNEKADEYLDVCESVFKDIDLENSTYQLMTLFDYERPAQAKILAKRLLEAQELVETAHKNSTPKDITLAKEKIMDLLADLEIMIANREV